MAFGRNERGEGGIKTLIVVAVVIYAIFAGIKVVGARADDADLADKAEQAMRFAGVNRDTRDVIQDKIFRVAKEADIALKKEDIKITEDATSWTTTFRYDRDLDLWVWHYKYPVSFDRTIPKG